MKDWKIYLSDFLSRSVIAWLEEYFFNRNIATPTLEQICEITWEEMLDSTLSVPSMKQLLLFQQQIKQDQ